MTLLIALIGIVAFVWLSSLNWRFTVKVALVLVIFEGVLRKWVLPQASDLIYFLKDFVLLGAYIRYYLSSELKSAFHRNTLTIVLLMAISWSVFQAFNPSLGSPVIGFFGLKAYFFYIPLMWMLPALFESQEELYEFLRSYLLLAIPVCLLAVAQFFSPPSSFINVYAGGQEANATVGDVVRVTGTFSYLLGYSTYLTTCFSFLIPMLILPQSRIWRWLTFAEALLVVGTSFMTGARGLILYEVLFVVGYASALLVTQPSIAVWATKQVILPTVFISALVPIFFSNAIDAFSSRATTASDSDTFFERTLSAFAEPEQAAQLKGFDGYGTGATHQAVSALRKALNLPLGEAPPPSEGEMGRIVLELGPLGFVFWYGLRLLLIFSIWRVFLKLKTPFLRQLALATLLLHLINITSQLVFNNTLGIYYWFFSGFIFLLPKLEYRQFSFYQQYVYPSHFPSSSN
jgi:hypothetical protein